MRPPLPTLPAFTRWADPSEPIETLDDLRDWHEQRCAYCGWQAHIFDTDHDHATGVIRGFLCRGCNLLIGKFPEPIDFGPYWEWMSGNTPAERFGIQDVYLKPQTGLPVFEVATRDDARAIFALAGLDFDALPDRVPLASSAAQLADVRDHVRELQHASYAHWRQTRTEVLEDHARIVAENERMRRG